MRVLHVMRESEEIYGAERVILAELRSLRARGIDARFLMLEELRILGHPGRMALAVEALGVPLLRVPVRSRISWPMIRAVRDAMVAEAPDCVHAHGYKGDLIGLLAARLAGRPVIGEVSGWLFPKRDPLIRFYEWLDVQALKLMDRVVVLSDHYRRLVLRMGMAARRVSLIPSGVDSAGLRARVGRIDYRKQLGLEPEVPVAGMLARLSHEKGVDIFLEAMALVCRRLPRARGVVFGSGPELGALLAQRARLGLEEKVLFPGYAAEAVDAIAACDLMAVTSRTEALPQTLMETMVMRRPAVVTPVGGCAELVVDGETGHVTPHHEPERIAASICHLLQRPELRRAMGEQGACRVEEGFTMDHWAQRTASLYRDVARA